MPVKKQKQYLAFDVETTSLEPWRGGRIFAWAFCNQAGDCKVLRSDSHPDPGLQKQINNNVLICHNAKFELSMLDVCGYDLSRVEYHDTMILAQLTDNLRGRWGLDDLSAALVDWPRDLDLRVNRAAKAAGGYRWVDKDLMTEYQKSDVQRTMLLFETFFPKVRDNEKLMADYNNELKLLYVTMLMEKRGVYFVKDNVEELKELIDNEVYETEKRSLELTGEYYNLASTDSLSTLLYKKLKLPVIIRTPSGKPATDKGTLDLLNLKTRHGIFSIIKKYRTYAMARGILSGYEKLVDVNSCIHPNIKTNHAATGREACDTPNLQNVSTGRSVEGEYSVPMRRCFSARPGFRWYTVDQSGIEIRLMIEAANCKDMMQMLLDGRHPHVEAGKVLRGEPDWKKTKDTASEYDTIKNAHFALCYGAGVDKLSETMGFTLEKMKRGYADYCDRWPEVAFLNRNGINRIRKNGCRLLTAFGRELRLTPVDINAWLNYFIQGTAAGIIKRGQVNTMKMIQKKYSGLIYMVLTVHDDINFEVSDTLTGREWKEDVRKCMVEIPEIRVPLDVEFKTGDTWDSMKEEKE